MTLDSQESTRQSRRTSNTGNTERKPLPST